MPALSRPAAVMTLRDWALVVFLSVLWGGSFFLNAVTVAVLPPLTVVLPLVLVVDRALGAAGAGRGCGAGAGGARHGLHGAGLLGEILLPRHLAGMALIALGLAAIDGRLPRAALRVAGARRRDRLAAGAAGVDGEKTP